MSQFNYMFTKDGLEKIKKQFPEFSSQCVLLYESQTEKKISSPYTEIACWLNPENKKIYYYEFESMVMPSGHLSLEFEIFKLKFENMQDFFNYTKGDKERCLIYKKIQDFIIEFDKNKIQDQLPVKEWKNKKAKI